jgi:hypothetical protein
MEPFRGRWYRILRFFSEHRTASVAILSPFPSMFLGFGVSTGIVWFFPFAALAYCLLIMAAVSPSQYAELRLVEQLQPVIHKVLGLHGDDRVAVMYMRSRKRELYEQLVDYFPTNTGEGRTFTLRKGIVGRCFVSRTPKSASLPRDAVLSQVLPKEWGYTADEAGYLRQDRRSFFAFPISEEGGFAKAVLYLDSSSPDRFGAGNEQGIAKKIGDVFQPLLERFTR